MRFAYLLRRLLRRGEWIRALGQEKKSSGFLALCKTTSQMISQGYAAIAARTEAIRAESCPESAQTALAEIASWEQKLASLLPFSTTKQGKAIADAQKCAGYARSLVPETKETGQAEIHYYAVYIPSLDGRFYYLANEAYRVGDVVTIPFGRENALIYGTVQEVLCTDYWKMPLPLWKMKYIDSKAPQAVAEEYRHQLENAKLTDSKIP